VTYIYQFRAFINGSLAEWRGLKFSELQYFHREIRLMMLGGLGLLLIFAIARLSMRRQPGRHHIVLPALPASIAPTRGSSFSHTPMVLFLVGLLFFSLAFADPHSPFVTSETSFPGRRIAVIVDASSSMRRGFTTNRLGQGEDSEAVFFTTVAAAKRFVELRMKGKYHDLVSLIEFGNEAYVVTPFTNDYDNILLSISLIGDPTEFSVFPDAGNTVIGLAVQQGVELFKAFKFLDASGNLLILFSDGEDTHAIVNGVPLDVIMKDAVEAKIPVYFIRTNWGMGAGKSIGDNLWIDAVEKTGGKFFAAKDDNSLIDAITEIDKLGAGTISIKQYANQQPRFAMFTAVAMLCWILAAVTKLTVPYFQKLP
jgi:von Willebrand factor type A domain